ncbi:MAG: Hsp20/alpha crystallin family protein [Candidatus Riflebacteria bacterium]|nr:Hsp20/alpha crystallin family protein [Candidatus Riflebacteria bacterium]
MFNIIRHDNDLFALPELVSRLLEMGTPGRAGAASIAAPVDVLETDKEFRLVAECPGLSRESLNVSMEGGTLTISGEKRPVWEVREDEFYRAERRFGKFSRSFTIPTRVDSSKIQATYKDGVLEVVLPKAPEAQPQKIQVSAGD